MLGSFSTNCKLGLTRVARVSWIMAAFMSQFASGENKVKDGDTAFLYLLFPVCILVPQLNLMVIIEKCTTVVNTFQES